MMEWVRKDIWELHAGGGTVVIPTNPGWKKDGLNPMGRGLALDADRLVEGLTDKELSLSQLYGGLCRIGQPRVWLAPFRLVLVPSKSLTDPPYLAWKNRSSLGAISGSLVWLIQHQRVFDKPIYVPLLGAGNGGLAKSDARVLIATYLDDVEGVVGVLPPIGKG